MRPIQFLAIRQKSFAMGQQQKRIPALNGKLAPLEHCIARDPAEPRAETGRPFSQTDNVLQA
jgi:hypothetical protein